jgi:hypothetical protein
MYNSLAPSDPRPLGLTDLKLMGSWLELSGLAMRSRREFAFPLRMVAVDLADAG